MESILRIVGLLGPSRRLQLFAVFLLMVITAFLEMLNIGLFLPLVHVLLNREGESNAVIDFIAETGLNHLSTGTSPFGLIAAVLVAVFIVKNIFIVFAIYLQARFVADLRAFFTVRLVEGYARRRYEEHLSVNSAHAVHDISQTAPSVVGSILQSGIGILMEILLASGALAALIFIDPVSALIAGGFVIVALTLYYLAIRRKVYELSKKSLFLSRQQSRFSHFFLGAMKESMVLRRGDYFVGRIRSVASDLAKINSAMSVIAQLPRIYGEIAIVGAIVLVAVYIIDSQGSAELALPLLAVFVAAAFRVLPSANRIAHHFSSLRQTAPLLDAIYPDLQKAAKHQSYEREIQAIRESDSKKAVVGWNIALRDVAYRYPNAKDWTLRDINISINRGEAVAFVGRTGAGKSTIIDIVLGLLPPTEGRILIDGETVDPGPNFWRGRIGYVPQNIYLMDDTLRRNIAIGIPDDEIDDQRLAKVIYLAHLNDVLASLSDGLDTEIGERGIRLSGGQRQRIGIARALYNDPEVLVLDEATSALDNTTERDIAKAIQELAGRKTVLIIAHRLSTVRRCDKLFFIDEGTILREGKFEDLLASCPPFAQLVEITGDKDVMYPEEVD